MESIAEQSLVRQFERFPSPLGRHLLFDRRGKMLTFLGLEPCTFSLASLGFLLLYRKVSIYQQALRSFSLFAWALRILVPCLPMTGFQLQPVRICTLHHGSQFQFIEKPRP